MRIELLCTGDEILSGKTINTNHAYMAQKLLDAGLTVIWGTIVGDDRASLRQAFTQAAERADIVICNGGLGPTVDDLTQEMAAEAAGVELELHQPWLDHLRSWYASRGRVMPEVNTKQAMLPAGAEFIDNPVGTACGFAVDIGKARFFFTPGVPREMKRMLDEEIIPRLLQRAGDTGAHALKRFHCYGLGESGCEELLSGIEKLAPNGSVKLGYQTHFPQLELKLAATADSDAALAAELAPVEAALRQRMGNYILAEGDDSLDQVIARALAQRDASLSIVEMLTAGHIAARFVSREQTTTAFRHGMLATNLTELAKLLNLDKPFDGVNATSAALAARRLREKSGSTLSLAVLSNYHAAIPEQSLPERCEFAIAIADGDTVITRYAMLPGNRGWTRLGGAEMALDILRRYLLGLPVHEAIDFELKNTR